MGVDDGSLQVDSQPKSVGLVWGLAATWRSVSIHPMNRVNSRHGLTMMTINIGIIIISSIISITSILNQPVPFIAHSKLDYCKFLY